MKTTKEKSILIVEDEGLLREILAEEFQVAGWTVYQAANGVDGLKSVQENQPKAVLSDVRMPGGDGIEMLKNIVATQTNLPIFYFVSAFSQGASDKEVRSLGAKGLISKPFSLVAIMNLFETELAAAVD